MFILISTAVCSFLTHPQSSFINWCIGTYALNALWLQTGDIGALIPDIALHVFGCGRRNGEMDWGGGLQEGWIGLSELMSWAQLIRV